MFPGTQSPVRLVSREMAEEVRRAILANIAQGLDERAAVAPFLPRESSVGAVLDLWLASIETAVQAGKRSPAYLTGLKRYAGPKGHLAPLRNASIHGLNLVSLEDFAEELSAEGMNATSIVHTLGTLKTALNWHAHRSSGAYAAPTFPKLSRADFEPVILTREQQSTVIDAIPVAQRGAFLAMADLLIRPGETRALDAPHYTKECREIRIERAVQGPTADSPIGPTKGRDRRLLIASDRLAAWIDAHAPRFGPLFPGPEGGRWSHSTLKSVWERAIEQTGVPAAGVYSGTKHSTASWLRSLGIPLDDIGAAMGHAWATRGKELTERYAQGPRVANAPIVHLFSAQDATRLGR